MIIRYRENASSPWKEIVTIRGAPGKDGITPHIGENGNWYIGESDTGVRAEGSNADAEPYEGSYNVTPSAIKESILPTADKYLSEDVVVEEIPYSEVSNDSGGTTVVIG